VPGKQGRGVMARFNSVQTVVVSSVMVAAVAAAGIYGLGYWARQAALSESRLIEIKADLTKLDSLKWRALLQGVDARMEQQFAGGRQRIDALSAAIKGNDECMAEFKVIYRDYVRATDNEFRLIKAGKLAEAAQYDRSVVDPLFDKLQDETVEMAAEMAEAKEHIGAIADIGMALSLLGSALIVAAMFSSFTASRSREAKKLYEARELAELSSDWSWTQDEDFRFVGAMDGAKTGLAPSIVGRTRWQLPVDPDGADWAAHRALLEAHQPFKDFEYKLVAGRMAGQWISTSGKPQFGADGKFTGYRGTTRVITERKLAEETLRRSQSELRQLAAHQEMVKENERARIARDIHDELGQNLLVLRLDVVRMAASAQLDAPAKEQLQAVLGQIDTTIKNVRNIINDLRPSVLDLGLHAAIEWQAKEFERCSGISCEVHIDHAEFALDEQLATAMFRSVQESLSNIIRHAQARQVWIDMRRKDDLLHMTISDDGVGDQAKRGRKENSLGLIGIEERMHALGGKFSRISEPDQGMTIMLSIPVDAAEGAPA